MLPPAGAAVATSAQARDRQPETEDYGDPTARVGAILAGKYKLIEEIGAGGMGSVYLAQQTEPVKRTVAVKVIKAGMDSRAVLVRFEAELLREGRGADSRAAMAMFKAASRSPALMG